MIIIKKAEITDCETLLAYSKKTFYEFFAHLNEPANMEAYSIIAFTRENIFKQLNNPKSDFYFALDEGNVVGYLKLNFNDTQTEFQDKYAMEVERIYVSGAHHGRRIGQKLLDFAINIALEMQLKYIWLGVWEHNNKATGFYEHNGFKVFGSHDFLLGEDRQTDLLMKKTLSEL